MIRTTTLSALALIVVALATMNVVPTANAFVARSTAFQPKVASTTTSLNIFNRKNKKEEEDLSFIETRDMTRAEMEQLNQQNEDIMNAELIGMTLFSLVISVPMLYLVWVGFFSETAGVDDLDMPY